ncbi:hypothetical protein H9P43_010058 [Blastocladiella emersonii ATCC 22665]|nr:hypothetical protein H9P43_010058 [Blastocladiella emersonii ATCC 22665]
MTDSAPNLAAAAIGRPASTPPDLAPLPVDSAPDPFAERLLTIDAEIAAAKDLWQSVTATASPVVARLDDPGRPFRVMRPTSAVSNYSSSGASSPSGGRAPLATAAWLAALVRPPTGHGMARVMPDSKPWDSAADEVREFELHALRRRSGRVRQATTPL